MTRSRIVTGIVAAVLACACKNQPAPQDPALGAEEPRSGMAPVQPAEENAVTSDQLATVDFVVTMDGVLHGGQQIVDLEAGLVPDEPDVHSLPEVNALLESGVSTSLSPEQIAIGVSADRDVPCGTVLALFHGAMDLGFRRYVLQVPGEIDPAPRHEFSIPTFEELDAAGESLMILVEPGDIVVKKASDMTGDGSVTLRSIEGRNIAQLQEAVDEALDENGNLEDVLILTSFSLPASDLGDVMLVVDGKFARIWVDVSYG